MPWSSKRRGPLESCSPATSKGSPSVLVSSPSREYARPPFLARLNFDTLPKWTKPETRLLLKFKIIARYLRRDFFIFFDLIFFRNPSRFFSLSFYTSSFVSLHGYNLSRRRSGTVGSWTDDRPDFDQRNRVLFRDRKRIWPRNYVIRIPRAFHGARVLPSGFQATRD